jgi:hypothetical protein
MLVLKLWRTMLMMEETRGMKMMKDPLMISRSEFETYSAAETKKQVAAANNFIFIYSLG